MQTVPTDDIVNKFVGFLQVLYSADFSVSVVAELFSSLAVCSLSSTAGSLLLLSDGPSMLSSFAPFSVVSASC